MFENIPERVNGVKDFFLEVIGIKKYEPKYLDADREYFESLNSDESKRMTEEFCAECASHDSHESADNVAHNEHAQSDHSAHHAPIAATSLSDALRQAGEPMMDFTPPIGEALSLHVSLNGRSKTIPEALTSYINSIERSGAHASRRAGKSGKDRWNVGLSWFETDHIEADMPPVWPIALNNEQREALLDSMDRQSSVVDLEELERAYQLEQSDYPSELASQTAADSASSNMLAESDRSEENQWQYAISDSEFYSADLNNANSADLIELHQSKDKMRSAYSRYIAKNALVESEFVAKIPLPAKDVPPTHIPNSLWYDLHDAVRIKDEQEDFSPEDDEMSRTMPAPIEQLMKVKMPPSRAQLNEKKMSVTMSLDDGEFETMLMGIVQRVEAKLADPRTHANYTITFDRYKGFVTTNETLEFCEAWLKETAAHPRTPVSVLMHLAKSESPTIRATIAKNPKTPLDVMYELSQDPKCEVRCAVACCEDLPFEMLRKLIDDENSFVSMRANYTLRRACGSPQAA